MIALRAASIERAVAEVLASGRAHVLRASRLELSLPPGVVESPEGEEAEAFLATADAATLDEVMARVLALGDARTIALALPVVGTGLLGWAVARARRLRPVVLEDACDALRRAGVVDVRVTTVDGSLPLVVVVGRTTAA